MDPLVDCFWSGYEVRFPDFRRVLDEPYASVPSSRMDRVVREAFAAADDARLLLNTEALDVGAHHVELADGRTLHGSVVIDARGPGRFQAVGPVAYQKFVGLELELSADTRTKTPVIMDATVPQTDGFRFFYTLPLEPQRVLVEDTYFSDSAELDVAGLRAGIIEHAIASGLQVTRVVRQETGVLPLPGRMPDAHPAHGPLQAGFGGGWFHPTTGYSFPVAVRLAQFVAWTDPSELFGEAFQHMQRRHRRQQRFALLLNRMLFGAFAPEDRWNALQRFYTLPTPTIRRFYAMSMSVSDRLRVLCGRPPAGLSMREALSRGWL